MIRTQLVCVFAIFITGSFAAAQAPAPAGGGQRAGAPPAPMKNLQVLPKDTPQPQVVAMMRMTTDVNARLAGAIKKPADQIAKVECHTCHRGAAIPTPPPPPVAPPAK